MAATNILFERDHREKNVQVSARNPLPVSLGATLLDAFGRVRVADPSTIFDSQLQYDAQPFLWETATVGSGTATHVADESTVDMDVTAASGDSVVRQTYEYFRYQPGKSQLVLMTTVFGAGQANTTKLVGYGDAANGIFMGQDGGGMFVLLRSSVTGSVSDARKVYQSSWNADVMDGTGPSGNTLDPEQSQIVFIDMEWLGVGSVRVGLVIDGVICYVHKFHNSNSLGTVYMTTANLPCRYEITNSGAAASTATLKHICTQVVSEGGVDETLAYPFSTELIGVSMGNGSGNESVVFAARHKLTFNSIENRAKWVPKGFTVTAAGGTVVAKVIYNPTVTGGSWASIDSNSVVEGNSTATGYSGGTKIKTLVVPAGTTGQATPNVQAANVSDRLPFGLNIAADAAIPLALVAYGIGTSITASFTFDWDEVR